MAGGTGSGSSGSGSFPGNGASGQGAPGGFVSGEVTATANGTLTVKETDGTVVKVTTTSSTEVVKRTTSSVSALKVGETVSVRGTTSNGTIAATSIDEGASSGFGGPGGAPGASGFSGTGGAPTDPAAN
jgi:hypothetical protein